MSTTPPPLGDYLKSNFQTLCKACDNDAVVLVSCIDKATKKPVAVVCAVNRNSDGTCDMVPLAKLFDGNPYEELEDPTQS